MSLTLILAIGTDPWLFESQRTVWQAAGFFVTTVGALDQPTALFRSGDFDIVLLGSSLSDQDLNYITRSIRALGSRVPIIRMSELSNVVTRRSSKSSQNSVRLINAIKEQLAGREGQEPTRVA